MPAIVCSVVPRITGLPAGIQKLKSLSLADRVVTERGHAVLGQQDADALIALVCLAVVAVPARNQHSRKRALALGQVQIARDVVAEAGFRRSLSRRGIRRV